MNKHSIETLQQACGATGQLQVSIAWEGKPAATESSLYLPFFLAGRDANTDIPLDDAQVSQRHTFFQILDGNLFAVDLRSRTGTHWDSGTRSSGWVEPGKVVRIGPYHLRFSIGANSDGNVAGRFDPLTSLSPDAATLPDVTLDFVQGPTRPMTWRISQTLTFVGRSNDCGVSLKDASVSFFHCVLLRTSQGTWIIDLLGRGGVQINGRRVRWGRLDDGDQIQIGGYLLRIRPENGLFQPAAWTTAPAPVANGSGHAEKGAASSTLGSWTMVAASPNGRALDKRALQQAILTPLVQQFAAVQNQMFSQFQQSLTLMVDRFREIHREQFGLIQGEVDRLHRITEELQTLQGKLARTKPQGQPTSTTKSAPPASVSAATETQVADPSARPVSAATATPAPKSNAASAPPLEIPPCPEEATDAAVHLWLHDRVSALQRDRDSTMQRIFKFLSGK